MRASVLSARAANCRYRASVHPDAFDGLDFDSKIQVAMSEVRDRDAWMQSARVWRTMA